jgi:hypothetical protein
MSSSLETYGQNTNGHILFNSFGEREVMPTESIHRSYERDVIILSCCVVFFLVYSEKLPIVLDKIECSRHNLT